MIKTVYEQISRNKYPGYEEVLNTYVEKWDANEVRSSANAYHYILPQFSLCLLNL